MAEQRTKKRLFGVYPLALCFCGLLFALALPDASNWLLGMNTILRAEGALITDYIASHGLHL